MFDRGPWLLIYGVACGALGGLGGFALGRASGEVLIAENVAPARAERQSDGSLVLERSPSEELPRPELPAHANLERQARAVVMPRKPSDWPDECPSCPPITVDLALVRVADGRRVIASSPDGRIVGGVDVPLEGALSVVRPWSAGASFDPVAKTPGVWIQRDYGRLLIGGDLYGDDGALAGRIRVGWRFSLDR